ADEGARAKRSVPLIFAWEGQEQLASLAPSSGAARHLLPLRRRRALSERCGRELTDEALLPFRRRRALSGRCGRDLTEEPFSRSREKVPGEPAPAKAGGG